MSEDDRAAKAARAKAMVCIRITSDSNLVLVTLIFSVHTAQETTAEKGRGCICTLECWRCFSSLDASEPAIIPGVHPRPFGASCTCRGEKQRYRRPVGAFYVLFGSTYSARPNSWNGWMMH